MRKLKAVISYIMIFALLISLFPINSMKVKAATGSSFNVQSYRFNSNTNKYELTIEWEGNKSTKAAKIEYHEEETSNVKSITASKITETTQLSLAMSKFTATFDVSSFQEDYMYDLHVITYDIAAPVPDGTTPLANGYTYFITGMTFESERVNKEPVNFESGTSPELKLSWKVPRVWNGSTSTWIPVTDDAAKTFMCQQLSLPTGSLSRLDFKVNISTKSQKLDSGSEISPVFIKGSNASYNASDESDTTGSVTVNSGYMSFNLVGRKDYSETPTVTDSSLYHSEIQPGTVYFMNIKLAYYNSSNEEVTPFTLGDPAQYNGSLVKDKASGCQYTYTPIRFKISRDASDNIYVTAYRINKDDGSLDMPNLYYSIQAIDTPINTYGVDWPEKARMTDQFFPNNSTYAITTITGVDPYTPMYYKVVVKTDSKSDRIESLKVLYQMSKDTSKPPIPINVAVDMSKSKMDNNTVNYPGTTDQILDSSGNPIVARSTDILLTWDKPSSFDTMTADQKSKLVYHVMLSTNPEDLETDYPLNYPDNFPDALKTKSYHINFRWILAVSANDVQVSEDGKKLQYSINGFELFKNISGGSVSSIENPDEYPEWFIENTIYYVKMFSTTTIDAFGNYTGMTDKNDDNVIDINDFRKAADSNAEYVVSQPSVVTSFTTLPGTDKQVPVPMGFVATGEGIENSENYINLQFNNASINWDTYTANKNSKDKVVYELYMASGSGDNPQYFQIGSSDGTFSTPPAGFTVAGFTQQYDIWTVKLQELKPNTIYNFKLRIKLDFNDSSITDLYSDFTSVVSVTTRKLEIIRPSDGTKIPMAPTDFSIVTKDGKQVLSGTGVDVNWSILESDVKYQMVVTSARIDEDADKDFSGDDFENDDLYSKFMGMFGTGGTSLTDSRDDVSKLDPTYTGINFTLDSTNTNICKYSVTSFMRPNNIYYYSLRAVRTVNVVDESGETKTVTLPSKWVTIPVTTSMIEEPLDLENIPDYQLGISWTDSTSGVTDKDFAVKIKKTSESAYKQLDITKAVITKDGNSYYARITGLESGTDYNVQVFRNGTLIKIDNSTTNTDVNVFSTRNEYKNVEIRWRGLPGYTYEIQMRNAVNSEYITLNSEDFKEISVEKTQDLVGTQYNYYYYRITKMPVVLSDGSSSTDSYDLTSNTKYYIKVRACSTNSQPSNYAGPVTSRTSFLQSDYDNNEDLNDTKAKLVDKIEEIEQKPYYQLNYILSTTNTLLLKGDRLAEDIISSPYHDLKIDLTEISSAGRVDEIYIPKVLGDTLKDSGGSIDFVVDKAEFKLVSTVLDEGKYQEVTDLKDDYSEKEIWFKLVISRPDGGTEGLDTTVTPVSQVNIFTMNTLAVSESYSDLKKDFTNKVYNSETGLIKEKKDELDDMYIENPTSFNSQGGYLIDSLVDEVKSELADYVKASIEGGYDSSSSSTKTSIILGASEITELASPVTASLITDKTDSYCQPYGLYIDQHEWRKLDALNNSANKVSFELVRSGKYFVGANSGFTGSIPKNHWAYQTIIDFNNKYNIADVFTATGDFDPDSTITLKDSILIIDKIFDKDSVKGESVQKKVSRLGLSTYFSSVSPVKDISREQAATLYVKSYALKNGLSINNIKPSSVVVFNDAYNISSLHYNNVENAVALGFINGDANGVFNPAGYVTRAEFITSLQRALH